MAFTAKQFQSVLDVVKKWHDQGFRDRLVNGQLALVDTEDYILKYTSKACALNSQDGCRTEDYILKYTIFEQQSRRMPHLHYAEYLCRRSRHPMRRRLVVDDEAEAGGVPS